ncbi:hypothetical protein GCM10007301_47810 [Azorhizobium oxalatiphilum]|uniref:Uncharacterized protein n=1 Tax=Azorhizobium oxalatiphilum TaxID=980631 RepID=A0A917CAK2_9HYPH|nr:hypothetical protein [Azorhizobium oxalatiphilum]GGF82134.1 hypothetical protein GCM10007301_47810 [Azorhizobium oxalatiphilum]
MSTILRFRKPPHVELYGGVISGGDRPELIGSVRYFVDYHDEEGGVVGMWDGASYDEARAVLANFRSEGMEAFDRLREAM